MTRVLAHEKVYDDPVVECIHRTTVHIPLDDVIEQGIHSWREPPTIRRPPRPRASHPWRHHHEPGPLRSGEFLAHLPAGNRRIEGFLRVKNPAAFPAWAVQHLHPQRGSSLDEYLRSLGVPPVEGEWSDASRDAMGRLPMLLGGPGDGFCDDLVPNFPGVYSAGPGDCMRFQEAVLVSSGCEGVEITVERRVSRGGQRVPVVLRLRVDEDGGWACSDGHAFLQGEDVDDLPPRLRRLMDRQGTAVATSSVPLLPARDLRPMFLLKRPPASAWRAGRPPSSAPPSCASRPGLLLPSTGSVPLLDRDGRLLDLPLVSDPADAMAILVRTGPHGVYVPHGRPLDPRDVDLRGDRWLIGAQFAGATP